MTRQDAAARIAALLADLRAIRDPRREARNTIPHLAEMKQWQAERLARSFFDLSRLPRMAAAAKFFLEDLYGAHDVTWRDRDIARMMPTLRAWLPASVLETVADALSLDLLSHRLDLDLVEVLSRELAPGKPIDDASYAHAYRTAARRAQRRRQLDLLLKVGGELDHIVKQPLVFTMLKIARGPAHVAGLGQLQSFLERGFGAFRTMGDATEFLDAIELRESEVMRRLFGAHPAPFDVGRSGAEQGARRRDPAGNTPARPTTPNASPRARPRVRGRGAARSPSRSQT